MDIYHLGHSSFKIKTKTVVIVTDPFSMEATGLKFPKTEADIVTVSHQHEDHNEISNFQFSISNGTTLVISGPGEYEVKGVKITGIASFHDDKNGEERGKNTIFKIEADGIVLAHLGDLGEKLSEKQLEDLDGVDILMLPVGNKYTLDAKAASETVSKIEPKIVIPMHYHVSGLKIEGLSDVSEFLKEMGKEGITSQPKLTISKDKFKEETEVIILE